MKLKTKATAVLSILAIAGSIAGTGLSIDALANSITKKGNDASAGPAPLVGRYETNPKELNGTPQPIVQARDAEQAETPTNTGTQKGGDRISEAYVNTIKSKLINVEGFTPHFAVGHNTFTEAQLSDKVLLPNVMNLSGEVWVDTTEIYIFNPNDSNASLDIYFYEENGELRKSLRKEIPAGVTVKISTITEFGTEEFSGSAIVQAYGTKVAVSYDKIDFYNYNSETETGRAWGIEGIPTAMGQRETYFSPITNDSPDNWGQEGWGVDNHYITYFNPSKDPTTVNYEYCRYDGVCTQATTRTIAAKTTITIATGFDLDRIADGEWWTGYIKITTPASQPKVYAISEDVGSENIAGSRGDYGRGNSGLYAPAGQMCLMPLTNDMYGIYKTGYGVSATELYQTSTPTTFSYYNQFGPVQAENRTLSPRRTFHRDTSWALGESPFQSLGEFHGVGMVSANGAQDGLFGRTQNIGATGTVAEAYGTGTSAVPCGQSQASRKVYLTGLNDKNGGIWTSSIQIFNPTNEAATVKVTIHNADASRKWEVELELGAYEMKEVVLDNVVETHISYWHGSAEVGVVSGNGRIVATHQSIAAW